MFRWYVVNTYSGHENKVKQNLEHRVVSLGQQNAVRQIVVPTESVSEMKDNQKVTVEKRTMPGYVLVNMDLSDDSWSLVKGTPGVTGFVGASNEPVPLTQDEVNRLLHREQEVRPRSRAQFSIGESVKVIHAQTQSEPGTVIPVVITVFEDRSFTFVTKSPPAAVLIKQALSLEKGSSEPFREKVGTITQDQLRQIAERKMKDLNANDVEAAAKIIAGTARSMGVEVV